MSEEAASLLSALRRAAGGLDGTELVAVGDGVEFRQRGRPYARADAGSASFRLDRVLAAAALGTPDVAPSPIGPGWVRFAPPVVDRFALDRAIAWLSAAWRRVPTSGGD